MLFEHLFQLSLSWLKYNIIYSCFVNTLVLSYNTRRHLYTEPVMEILLLFHQNRRFSLMNSDLCCPGDMQLVILQIKRRSHRLTSSLQIASWLPRGSNWSPVSYQTERGVAGVKEETCLLPLPHFPFKKTNAGSRSGRRWDRCGSSELPKLTCLHRVNTEATRCSWICVLNDHFWIRLLSWRKRSYCSTLLNICNSKLSWLEAVMSWIKVSTGNGGNDQEITHNQVLIPHK